MNVFRKKIAIIIALAVIAFTDNIFCAYGFGMKACNPQATAALATAIENNDTNAVKVALESDANIHETIGIQHCSHTWYTTQYTPLQLAAAYCDPEIVALLLEKKAPINTGKPTPLMLASRFGQFETVRLLLENKADANAYDSTADTALTDAIIMGHFDIMELLLNSKANVHQRDSSYGCTALMRAALEYKAAAIGLLLKYNADIDAVDASGKTALRLVTDDYSHSSYRGALLDKISNHYRGQDTSVAVIQMLIAAGARHDIRARDGSTILQTADRHTARIVKDALQKREEQKKKRIAQEQEVVSCALVSPVMREAACQTDDSPAYDVECQIKSNVDAIVARLLPLSIAVDSDCEEESNNWLRANGWHCVPCKGQGGSR